MVVSLNETNYKVGHRLEKMERAPRIHAVANCVNERPSGFAHQLGRGLNLVSAGLSLVS